jgi:hypothetical protein
MTAIRLIIFVSLAGCATTLPHRPLTELSSFGQGHNPGRDQCVTGQVSIYLELDDGQLIFLECYRGTTP